MSPGKEVDVGSGKNSKYALWDQPGATGRRAHGVRGPWDVDGKEDGEQRCWQVLGASCVCRGFHLPDPVEIALTLLKERTSGFTDVNRFPQLHAAFGEPNQVRQLLSK